MDATIAPDALAGAYRVLTDLGCSLAGILALIAGILAWAAGRHQARVAREAADAQIAALREEGERQRRQRETDDNRRREDLRFALASEAARVGELVAHRYRMLPLEYGPGRLETVARSACDIFKLHAPSILRTAAGASMLLDRDMVAAAAALDDAVDALNSLLAVEGALGRLPAVELMNAFENVTEAVKRLRAATLSGPETAPRPPRRVPELVTAAQG
jgi:hypothetical protein